MIVCRWTWKSHWSLNCKQLAKIRVIDQTGTQPAPTIGWGTSNVFTRLPTTSSAEGVPGNGGWGSRDSMLRGGARKLWISSKAWRWGLRTSMGGSSRKWWPLKSNTRSPELKSGTKLITGHTSGLASKPKLFCHCTTVCFFLLPDC